MRFALIALLALVAVVSARSLPLYQGGRPIVRFCANHCSEACGRLQVQSDIRMSCENACKWSCDHKRNAHIQPAVMSDAKFFKKAFKKIGKVVKKVGKVVKKVGSVVSKVTSLPGTLITKVVSKLPLPSGLKKVLAIAAPIATGFLTGGAGALSGLKSVGFINKAITAVKASKVGQIVSKVANTVKMVKGKIGAVKGLIKGKLTAVGDLVKGKIGNVVGAVKGKIGNIVQKVKDSKIYKTFENVKNKVKDVKNKIVGKVNGIVGKVVDFKNNALGKLDKFGAIGGFVKDKINDKINQVASGVKAKIQDKINNVKEKIMQKTGIAKVRDLVNKGKAKYQQIKGKIVAIGQKYDDFVARI